MSKKGWIESGIIAIIALAILVGLLLAGCASVDEATGRTDYSLFGLPISSDEPAKAGLTETEPWHEEGFANLPEEVQVAAVRVWNFQHGDSGGSHWSLPALIAMGLIGLRQVSPTGLRNWRTILQPSASWPDTGRSLLALTGIGTTPEAARPKA